MASRKWKVGNCVGFVGTGNTAKVAAVHGGKITLRNPDGTEEVVRADSGYLVKKRSCRLGRR